MSSSNLNLVRSIYAPWKRGDVISAECAHPEIEFVVTDAPGIKQGSLAAGEPLAQKAVEGRTIAPAPGAGAMYD